jgi:SAM-dependent methyltransferase
MRSFPQRLQMMKFFIAAYKMEFMTDTHLSLRREILSYYNIGQEAGRLHLHNWEKIRTLDLLHRLLPAAPAVVFDVGGGAGAYAFPLAQNGYIVDLVDPVPLHVEQAKRLAAVTQSGPRSIQVGDARALSADNGTADVVLLFGPLYHLIDRNERLTAIREACRVLRPAGVLLAVAISRFASALDGIGRGLIRDPEFVRIVEQDLKAGQHSNETGNPDYFTTAFLHHPDEFKQELIDGGFADPALLAIEGPVWAVAEATTVESRDALMRIMRIIENEPTMIGASAHIMGVAKRV